MKILKNKYIITTFCCIILYLAYLKIMQIYPFGEYSILKSDLYQQYINFLCYLKEIIIHGKSIIFSWNLGLANNFYTTFAYYLISPLNIFVIFFNSSNMDIFVEISTFIKIALMANFTVLFLEKSYNFKNKEALIFGLIYAFSSYVICYSFHIMWLDNLYMLPIILMFVDKYIKTNKIILLLLSLSYAILTNYYIGYMVAIFSGIYFLARCYILQRKDFVKSLIKFIITICLSFGIGMVVILPSLLQLKGKMNVTNIKLVEIDIEKIRLFINVLFNNYIYMFTQKSCFIFSSTIVTLLLPMYYLNKKIKKREKIAFTLIVIFLLLPIISPFLNKLWHAFTIPNCFNYRYSFLLIFTLILMSAREFQNKKATCKWQFIVSLEIFSILTILELILIKYGFLKSDGYIVTTKSVIISYLTFLSIIITVYLFFYHRLKNITAIMLILVLIIDLLIGAKSGQNNNDKYFKRDIILQHDKFMNYFMKKIQNPETERIVFEPDEYGSNMSLKYGYSNIGFFTSARNREVLKSMYKLGYNVQMDEQLWMTSYSGTFLNYSMAGVKYYIAKHPIEIFGFEFEEKYDDYYIYKNKNALNIGYYLSKNIKKDKNPFEMQNEILSAMSFNKISTEKSFQDIENSSIIDCNKQIELKGDEKYIKYKLKAKKDCSIYLSSDYDLQIYIENKPIFRNYSNIWSTETGIKQIKQLKKGETLEFILQTKHNLDLIYIYASNNNEIQRILSNKQNTFENVKINNNGLIGTTYFKNDGYLIFSIAYDKCWKAYIDYKEVNIEPFIGSFLKIDVKKGKHKIELKAK